MAIISLQYWTGTAGQLQAVLVHSLVQVPEVVMLLYSKLVIKLCMVAGKAQGNTAAFMTG